MIAVRPRKNFFFIVNSFYNPSGSRNRVHLRSGLPIVLTLAAGWERYELLNPQPRSFTVLNHLAMNAGFMVSHGLSAAH
jgi:hypothetical protein